MGATTDAGESSGAGFGSSTTTDVPGFLALIERPYAVQMGSFVRHGIDVVYVVECPTQHATAHRLAHRPAISAR